MNNDLRGQVDGFMKSHAGYVLVPADRDELITLIRTATLDEAKVEYKRWLKGRNNGTFSQTIDKLRGNDE